MDRGPETPVSTRSKAWPTSHPTSVNRLLAWDCADSSYPRPSRLETAAQPPGYQARNPCSSAPSDRSGSGLGHNATRYAFDAGPARGAANPPVDRAVAPACDSRASLRVVRAPRSAAIQTAGGHGPDRECASATRTDLSLGCVGTTRPD